jgi:Tfp pilus assembly protein PilW
MRTSTTSERGFSLIELMIASLITMVVMSVAFRTFADALQLNDAVVQMADSSQNLRAGTNLLVRDLLEAGRNIQPGGIAIPSGGGSTAIHRPGPDTSLTFDNTTETNLSVLTTGEALGPNIDGQTTDVITIVLDDPFLSSLDIYPSTNTTNVPKLSADGSSFNVGPSASWIQGDPNNGIAAIKPGDLIYFLNSGTTIQTVTKVDAANVYFEPGDPFNFNQPGAAAGNITQMLDGSIITIRRVLMFTYYVKEEEPGVPRLMRQLNFFPAQALAGVIEDLQLSYDVVDGTYNPVAVANLPYSANSVTYTANQIRKVNVHVGVRSETKNPRSKDYLRNHLSTVVSIRNLAYVDRYK